MRLVLPIAALGAALFGSLPASAAQDAPQAPALNAEQQALLRCSVAVALVSTRQEQGDAAALAFPPMVEQGREFFVRAMAQLMDQLHLNREGVTALVVEEATRLAGEQGKEDAVMPACLVMMEPVR